MQKCIVQLPESDVRALLRAIGPDSPLFVPIAQQFRRQIIAFRFVAPHASSYPFRWEES